MLGLQRQRLVGLVAADCVDLSLHDLVRVVVRGVYEMHLVQAYACCRQHRQGRRFLDEMVAQCLAGELRQPGDALLRDDAVVRRVAVRRDGPDVRAATDGGEVVGSRPDVRHLSLASRDQRRGVLRVGHEVHVEAQVLKVAQLLRREHVDDPGRGVEAERRDVGDRPGRLVGGALRRADQPGRPRRPCLGRRAAR